MGRRQTIFAENKTVYAVGTAYSLTNAQAALDFGTTDPSITLDKPGTWLIFAKAVLDYNGATFAASRTATLKLRRTNNTAADVTGASVAVKTDIITTLTYTMVDVAIPPVIYQTNNSNDIITIFGGLDTAPTAGSLDASSASIVAIKIS